MGEHDGHRAGTGCEVGLDTAQAPGGRAAPAGPAVGTHPVGARRRDRLSGASPGTASHRWRSPAAAHPPGPPRTGGRRQPVPAPAPGARRISCRGACLRAGLDAARGPLLVHGQPAAPCAAAGRAMDQPAPDQRAHALGQRQHRRGHPPELAAHAAHARGHRLRGRARAVPPAPHGPQSALLGHGGQRDAGLGGAAQLGIEAYNILEGFEGDVDANSQRGHVGGWRLRGLPWRQ